MNTQSNHSKTVHRSFVRVSTWRLANMAGFALSGLAACSGGGDGEPEELTGVADLAITAAPGVNSVSVSFEGTSRGVSRCLPVDGQPTTRLQGLPTGSVVVSAAAYPGTACEGDATWLAEPQTVRLSAGAPAPIQIVFRPNGIATIGTTFTDDVDCGAQAQSWQDDFTVATLDPAWTLWQYDGERMNGQSAGLGRFSLEENTGNLRFTVEPMLIPGFRDAFGGYAPAQNTYWYDPSIELSRALGGSHWTVEARVEWHVPTVVNAAGFFMAVDFGRVAPPEPERFSCQFYRFSNEDRGLGVPTEFNRFGASCGAGQEWAMPAEQLPSIVRHVRFERTDRTLVVGMSEDGASWTDLVSGEIPESVSCAPQRVLLSSHSWFSPADSFADYDYIRFQRRD